MTLRRYRLEIYNRGVVSTTGAVAWTFNTSQFKDAPTVRTQIVRAAEGIVESQPWACRLMDTNQSFSALLADSSGRMHLLGRLARLRSSLDSTATSSYQNLSVARFTDLQMAGDVATYDCTFSDERWVERQTQVFTKANTGMLIPMGVSSAFHSTPATPPLNWKVEKIVGVTVMLSLPFLATKRSAFQLIIDDVKPGAIGGSTTITAGNFSTVRFRDATNSVDREVATFDTVFAIGGGGVRPGQTFVETLQQFQNPASVPQSGHPFQMWVYWPTSQPSLGATVKGYVYAPTHPPTMEFPFHLGGPNGKHPFKLAEELYQGTYSGTTSLTVRFSTAAFAALKNDPAYGVSWWRITQPYQLDEFLDNHLYGPYSVAPFVDSSGKVAPLSLRLPHSTAITPATLPTLGSSNLIAGTHPTWEHPSNEIVNAVRIEVPSYQRPFYSSTVSPLQFFSEPNIDGIIVSTGFVERTHDSITNVGRRERRFALAGAVAKPAGSQPPTTGTRIPTADEIADQLAANIFPRFGDGPIYSSLDAQQTVDTSTAYGRLLQGRFVKVVLATFPNPTANARGSTFLMQLIERQDRPDGPSFRALGIGANTAALAAPTLTLAQSTRSPRHAVVATIGSIAAGARWEAQFAITTTGTTSAPVTTSTKWFPVKGTSRSTSSTTFTRGLLPSKSRIWGRARAFKPGRIGSNWSANTTSSRVVTSSITAPSGFAVSSLTAGTAVFKWANGSSEYGVDVMVDATSGATLGTTQVVARLPALTTRFDVVGLNANDGHIGGVRHFDQFGGVSANNTATFTTTTGRTVAPSLKGITILWGA